MKKDYSSEERGICLIELIRDRFSYEEKICGGTEVAGGG